MFRIPKWSKISVEMYQFINDINQSDMTNIDKLLQTVSILTGKTVKQLDILGKSKRGVSKFNSLTIDVKKRFEELLKPGIPVTKFKGLKFNFDIENLKFGQYIEIQHFIKQGQIEALHLIAASMCENENAKHQQRAERILQLPFLPIFWNAAHMIEKLNKFNLEYKGLLGIDEDIDDELKPEQSKFNDRYGWIYSAKKVADFENISLEQAFDLPVRQAFNDLAYLKELNNYEYELNKRQLGGVIHH
jgi:hypothetical protein